MDNLFYLYELTLSNYINLDDDIYPIYETLLIEFLKKHYSIVSSKEMLHQFILYLHYELDCLFYRQPKYDVRSEVNRFDKSRLKAEVKKLSKQIQKKYLSLNKKNI